MQNLRQRKNFAAMLRDRKGGVLLVGAITLPVVIGAAALATEFGFALANRVENQRVADLASYAGAVAYSKNKSQTDMQSAAERIAQLNGLESNNVSASLVASPRTPGASAVSVTVTTQKSLVLAPVLGFDTGMDIAALAMAEVAAAAAAPSAGCILALQEGGSGLVLEGGTTVRADNCEVSSNAVVTVPCGTFIYTPKLNYNSNSAPSQPCKGILAPAGGSAPVNKTVTPDPLASHAGLKKLVALLDEADDLDDPDEPKVSKGTDIEFAWDQKKTTDAAKKIGCTATWSQPTWTLTCPATLKTVNVGSFSVGGGINVNFAEKGASDVTYNFSGSIKTAGTVKFGPGNYNIKEGLITGGGSTTTFGAGTFHIGDGKNDCSGRKVSICNTARLTIGGPSTFILTQGIYNGGGSTIELGSGTTNSYHFGGSSKDNAIELGGGSTTILHDATGSTSKFEMVGNIAAGGGGSCLALPAAAKQLIDGNFIGAGAVILGSGIWALEGYMHFASGGSASCMGRNVSIHGENVTIIVSGEDTPKNGTCANRAFCVAGGYSGIVLKAPTSGDYRDLAFIGPQHSSDTYGALFAGGASGSQISGAFYFPYGPIMMDGGASASAVDSGCLTLIGSAITLKGGTSALSQCAGLTVAAPAGSGRVSLVR